MKIYEYKVIIACTGTSLDTQDVEETLNEGLDYCIVEVKRVKEPITIED